MISVHRRLGIIGLALLLVALSVGFSQRPRGISANQPIAVVRDDARTIERVAPGLNGVAAPQARVALFDAISGVTSFSAATAPHTYMGQPFNLSASAPITGVEFLLASLSATTYTNVQVRVQFWNTFSSGATSVFTSPVGPLLVYDLGQATLALNALYPVTLPLTSPISLTGPTNHGISINIRGDTGAGAVDTTNLTTAIRGGPGAPAFAAGSVPLAAPNYGYYRNASNRTDMNFSSTDPRNIGANSALALALYTGTPDATPTPTLGTPTVTTTATLTITPGTPTVTITTTPGTPTVTITTTPGTPTVTTTPTLTTTPGTPTVTTTPTLTTTPGTPTVTTTPGTPTTTPTLNNKRYLPLVFHNWTTPGRRAE